jgi:hypothetical protein
MPVVKNIFKLGYIKSVDTLNSIIIPIRKPPTTFTINVPNGILELNKSIEYLKIKYLIIAPMQPPIPT